jgi:tRNA (guanine26-N2/guanine27-N2)-dimethyltransferase
MVTDGDLLEITEGGRAYLVPRDYNSRGPGSITGSAFYNRQMEFNRDVCISFLSAVAADGFRILDANGATGIRSARIALEIPRRLIITCNDTGRNAASVMSKNFGRLGLDGIRITSMRAQALLAQEHFDYIDIDPFGTPVTYIPPAVQSASSGGFLAITATDAAVLCGSARGSERRYLCRAGRWPFMHEVGLRNLTGYVVRMAASYDRAAYPLLSYYADHYFRIYFRIEDGVTEAERQLESIGYAHYDSRTGERRVDSEYDSNAAGPMWIGSLHDRDTVNSLRVPEASGTGSRLAKWIEIWKNECNAPPLYYSMDEIAAMLRISMPKREELLELLSAAAPAFRTHFDSKGIKTRLTMEEIRHRLDDACGRTGTSGTRGQVTNTG